MNTEQISNCNLCLHKIDGCSLQFGCNTCKEIKEEGCIINNELRKKLPNDVIYYIEKLCGNVSTELIRANDIDIAKFRNKVCNHRLSADNTEILVYDEIGTPYDTRYCGVCGEIIGYV